MRKLNPNMNRKNKTTEKLNEYEIEYTHYPNTKLNPTRTEETKPGKP